MTFSFSQKLAPTWDELGQSFETDPLGNKINQFLCFAKKKMDVEFQIINF